MVFQTITNYQYPSVLFCVWHCHPLLSPHTTPTADSGQHCSPHHHMSPPPQSGILTAGWLRCLPQPPSACLTVDATAVAIVNSRHCRLICHYRSCHHHWHRCHYHFFTSTVVTIAAVVCHCLGHSRYQPPSGTVAVGIFDRCHRCSLPKWSVRRQ